jgi:hypothetical protein
LPLESETSPLASAAAAPDPMVTVPLELPSAELTTTSPLADDVPAPL